MKKKIIKIIEDCEKQIKKIDVKNKPFRVDILKTLRAMAYVRIKDLIIKTGGKNDKKS